MNMIKSISSEVTCDQWLRDAAAELKTAGIASARLDAEIILAHTIKKSRVYLHAHGDDVLDDRTVEIANARLELRRDFTPIAYIIGHKEFYGRRFRVTTATLIPRPESEVMIDMLKDALGTALPLPVASKRLIDVGTGSGCLGITAKLEFPELHVTLSDISQHALHVAEINAEALEADITTMRSDLLRGYALPTDIILANLPYVDRAWEVSPETHAEPELALYATHHGLQLIDTLILQASSLLTHGGLLFLEADPRQHASIIATCKEQSLTLVRSEGFILEFVGA